MNENLKGLTGYYFKDSQFSDLSIIAPTVGSTLLFSKDSLKGMKCLENQIQSIRWIGFIKANQTGKYVISSDSKNCMIEINNNVLDSTSSINLTTGKFYRIRIEQLLDTPIILKDYLGIKLYWKIDDNDKTLIPLTNMIEPEYSDMNDDYRFIPNDNMFNSSSILSRASVAIIDSDNDGIPDSQEINGYTVKDKIIVDWDESYSELGLKKYVSNPYKARTANDPYTDKEKVLGNIDPSVSLIARDPLIAAYPIIRVSMENLLVTKNSTITGESGSSMAKAVTTGQTQSNTAGTEISGEIGFEGFPNFKITASANYSHTWETSNSVEDTTGTSFTKGLSINSGEAAYINPNVRYYNTGTAPVYNLSPSITLTLNGGSIASIKAQPNQIGGYINPGQNYPAKNLPPLAFNTMDPLSTQLIAIDYGQLQEIDKGTSIDISVPQFTGNFAKYDSDGNIVTSNNSWTPYLGQMESSTSTMILETKYATKEVRIAARNSKDSTDNTPEITVLEALQKAFNIQLKGEDIYFEGITLPAGAEISIFMDDYTKNEMDEQLKTMQIKNFLYCKIRPRMNITITAKEASSLIAENKTYRILSYLDDKKCMKVDTTNGVNKVVINELTNESNEKWTVKFNPSTNLYTINNLATNAPLCFDSASGDDILRSKNINSINDKSWSLEDAGYNSYYFKIKSNLSKVADLTNQNTTNNTPIILCDKNGGRHQKWVFQEWSHMKIKECIDVTQNYTSSKISDIKGIERTDNHGNIPSYVVRDFSFKVKNVDSRKYTVKLLSQTLAVPPYYIKCVATLGSISKTAQQSAGGYWNTNVFEFDFPVNENVNEDLLINITSYLNSDYVTDPYYIYMYSVYVED